MKKPPLGLMPRIFHDESRFKEVCEAISRAYNEGAKIPLEWIEEYNDLIPRIKQEKIDLLDLLHRGQITVEQYLNHEMIKP